MKKKPLSKKKAIRKIKQKAKVAEPPKELPPNDHRALGQSLDLFSFHEIAPGAPFWHNKGMIIFRELERYARKINDENGYQEISTPILVKKDVFEKSGHWDFYRDNMFWFNNPRDKKETLVVKPMNCPESTYIYNSTVRSYNDLPLRLAEIGRLNRNELSGTLGGLFRVRQITMDDAHIFVCPEQVEEEVAVVIKIIEEFYSSFGFKPRYVLATRPKKALGTKKVWDTAEHALEEALKKQNTAYSIDKGEGAFYGPKIEVHMEDSQGRDWQMGTAQLDLVMLPKQFNLSYIDKNGKKQMPWVIHRAVFGSFERFIGILLEHFSGALPFWLSPMQARILTINDKVLDYAKEVEQELKKNDVRVEIDGRNESLGKKIREGEMQKIPYLLIVGEKEKSARSVNVRERGKGDLGAKALDDFMKKLPR
ncbi:MAG: threonine--tRNA ligase [Candidatus Ryanbacteria bacterium RIFCSPHIGHO2_01_FULL_45_22]|uniref:Threonine--tRNA ligase n=2 Tax=Candidatus Ryaniibacteriota TaxID=1817914 RepID=A0A1G2G148_9BACT|nr:MAG: threonine--tRNA ligase [Candidatus Ryanbacteria bacterium RIFCSPHIGHO2_01_FULL_45_22]OGZ46375.1 MAG: threonine--tRNA ligase [Candidatus Ryanbacteria bacterium RIFCSPHIGHO2_02_FULL_45_13b]